MNELINFANIFFLYYLLIYATLLTLSSFYSSVKLYKEDRLKRLQNKVNNKDYFPMSITVPAYNEELTIIDTINNLLKLKYPCYEIIIIDDGSKDNTKKLVLENFNLTKKEYQFKYDVKCEEIKEYYDNIVNGVRIILISKVNGRYKADASNAGINVANYPYIVNMDADELLQVDALKEMGKAILKDDKIIALGGNIRISNNTTFKENIPSKIKFGNNILANSQEIEYSRAFIGSRILFDKFNCNLIVSGGYGVFKKEALVNVGGYDKKSMGEDMELTIKLHKYYTDNNIPYVIKHVPSSICYTQVPANIKDLKKQRRRWHCGLMQTMYKYKSMLFNPKYKAVGLISLPYSLIYELLAPVFIFIGLLVIGLSIYLKVINFKAFMTLSLIYLLFGVILTMTNYLNRVYLSYDKLHKIDIIKVIYLTIFDFLVIRLYLAVINMISYFKLNQTKKGWISPTRIANNIM